MNFLDHEPDCGSPLFKGENSSSLAWRDKSLLCSNFCLLAVCPVHPEFFALCLCGISGLFSIPAVPSFLSFFFYSVHLEDSYLLFPDSLGKADFSLRCLSFLLCVLCSWHVVHMPLFLYSQRLSIMPGRSWMLNLC